MTPLLENNIRGGISSVVVVKCVNSDENKKKLSFDANILYGLSMSQPLPYDETKSDKNDKLKVTINTTDDNDFRYFLEVGSRYKMSR